MLRPITLSAPRCEPKSSGHDGWTTGEGFPHLFHFTCAAFAIARSVGGDDAVGGRMALRARSGIVNIRPARIGRAPDSRTFQTV